MTVSFTFPLIEEPPPPEPTPSVGEPEPSLAPLAERALLGVGLLTPFRRDGRSDFASGGGAALVRSAIGQVLGVRADDGRVAGELPWRPEFGSLLHRLQFVALDEAFGSVARSRVVAAIGLWEPRARITSVQVLRDTNTSGDVVGVLHIVFDVVQTGSENVLARNQALDVPLPT